MSVHIENDLGFQNRKPTIKDIFGLLFGLALLAGLVAAFVFGRSVFGVRPNITEVSLDPGKSLFVVVAPDAWERPLGVEEIEALFGAAYEQVGLEAKDRGKKVVLIDTVATDSTWIVVQVRWQQAP